MIIQVINEVRPYSDAKLEDFITTNGETIFVSTIHKAKGKEFDTVFIMLNGCNPDTDDKRRQLYVAMTRAKHKLSIHLNGHYLDDITTCGHQFNTAIDSSV
ncbi:MAG TPA: ATP-binding domain-containing protein [Chitinispirillaceae bacterium]|nr:ATP-binding domain-containing protein [Chitinispirillaceae bacterium]